MTNDESNLLNKYLSNASNYFEYGGGVLLTCLYKIKFNKIIVLKVMIIG